MRSDNTLPCLLLTFLLIVGVWGSAAAGQRVTNTKIRYVTTSSEPRLVITLSTNPALLIPKPDALNLKEIQLYHEKMMAFANWDDPSVVISFRLVGYGSDISISDAMIKKGPGVSFDAGYFASSNMIRHVGQITISEFSEDVIRGTYSAALFSTLRPKIVKPEGNVSGWFVISFPSSHDPRIDNKLPDSELVRLNLATMWDTLRAGGFVLGDGDLFASRGGGGGSAATARGGSGGSQQPACTCECSVMVALPDDHPCIQPTGQCYQGLKICKKSGLGAAPVPGAGDLDAIINLALGPNAAPDARAAMRKTLEDLTPEEVAQMLQFYRQVQKRK